MTSGGDGLRPKVVWRFKLRQHGPCHIHECPILPLGNTILLRGISSEILMFDTLITKEVIQGVVFEFGAIVTPYHQHRQIVLSLNHVDEVDEVLLGLSLHL